MDALSQLEELPDHQAVEVMSLRLRLRDDLKISVQSFAGETCYICEDPITSRFYRFGLAEYTFISLLSGSRPIADAIAASASVMGGGAIDQREATNLAKWLVDSGLALTDQSRRASRIGAVADRAAVAAAVGKVNPMFHKFRLMNPNRAIGAIARVAGAAFTVPAALAWVAVVACAIYLVWADADQFSHSASQILTADNSIWLALTWIGLKLAHELGHGVACRRFGGRVKEAGVMFVLFVPLPYVDVTSSWAFRDKWHRVVTAAAGMYVELLIAAIAAIVWSTSDSAVVRHHATGIVLSASLVTLLFNANPLMRFDGYYILTDWLEMPNLATHGNAMLRYFGNRYGLGINAQKPEWPDGRARLVTVYGFAALSWRILICISLATAASMLFAGAGIALTCVAVAIWTGLPLSKFLRVIATDKSVNRHRVACLLTAGCIAIGGSFFWMPWVTRLSIPIVIDYAVVHEVRPATSGFIRQLFVDVGQQVKVGEVIAKLDNPDLKFELRRLDVELQQSLHRIRIHRGVHAIAALQAETAAYNALQDHKTQLTKKLADLTVKASADGIIVACPIINRESTFVHPGQSIATIGDPTTLRAHGLVRQDAARHLPQLDGRPLPATIHAAQAKQTLALASIEPRATSLVTWPALTALAGGDIAVIKTPTGQNPSENDAWQLEKPHVPITFDIQDPGSLRAGQTGVLNYFHYQPTYRWQL